MMRLIAVLFLFLPGLAAAYGIKLMRDSLFNDINTLLINAGFQFVAGGLLFVAGIGFIGGFIVHRDRKRQHSKRKRRD